MTDSSVLTTFKRDVLGDTRLPPTDLHPSDFMMQYLLDHHYGHFETALFDYFRSGWSAWRTFSSVLRWRFGQDLKSPRLLDFASGFGRITRWMVSDIPARNLVVADIFPEALSFQRDLLGVRTAISSATPDLLEIGQFFDCIIASSFFSHIGPHQFPAWLDRLLGALNSDGLLVFSVHGAELVNADQSLYEPTSEIDSLPGERYGTSWVTERFVVESVRALRPSASIRRLPKALWSYQDLYIVALDGRSIVPPLLEPVAFMERAERIPHSRTLYLQGWAFHPTGESVTVDIRLNGAVVARTSADGLRPDVARYFQNHLIARSGWGAQIDCPSPLPGNTSISVIAVAENGLTFPMNIGSLEAIELYVRLRTAQVLADTASAEALRLRRLVEHMRRSRFWRVRESWHRLTRHFRSPDGEAQRLGRDA